MLPIILIAFLETGWMPTNIANYQRIEDTSFHLDMFYAKMEMETSWEGFYAGGSIRVVMEALNPISFAPNGLWSAVQAGWRNDFLDIGWRHECDHPVVVAYQTHPGIIEWEGGWDELFARVTLRLSP